LLYFLLFQRQGALLHIEELFVGKIGSLQVSRTTIFTTKAPSSFQEAIASTFLSENFGSQKVIIPGEQIHQKNP
jgi:hypothetical protein